MQTCPSRENPEFQMEMQKVWDIISLIFQYKEVIISVDKANLGKTS